MCKVYYFADETCKILLQLETTIAYNTVRWAQGDILHKLHTMTLDNHLFSELL